MSRRDPRYTGDIDFMVRPTSENARRVLDALADFGFRGTKLDVSDLAAPGKVIQLGRPPNRIDLLTWASGIEFDEAWSSRVPGDLDGIPVLFPARDVLLKNKRASGRPKDLADVEALEPGSKKG